MCKTKLFWNRKAKKKADMFRTLISDMIESLDNKNQSWASCYNDIMKLVDESIKVSEDDFMSFPAGYNYEELALNMIRNMCYYLIKTGQYHVYAGVLKPTGEQLRFVCSEAARIANEKQYLSDEDYEDFNRSLAYIVKTYG